MTVTMTMMMIGDEKRRTKSACEMALTLSWEMKPEPGVHDV